jgi:hypothetical protein
METTSGQEIQYNEKEGTLETERGGTGDEQGKGRKNSVRERRHGWAEE